MPDGQPQSTTKLRDDIVVSVCFFDLVPNSQALERIRDLAAQLDQVYRFREIILIVGEGDRDAVLPFVEY